jgi:hypothetical protein
MPLFLMTVSSYTRWCTYENAPPSPFLVARLGLRCRCGCGGEGFWTFVALSLN